MMARPTKMMITILCFLCVGKSFSSLIYPCEDVEEEFHTGNNTVQNCGHAQSNRAECEKNVFQVNCAATCNTCCVDHPALFDIAQGSAEPGKMRSCDMIKDKPHLCNKETVKKFCPMSCNLCPCRDERGIFDFNESQLTSCYSVRKSPIRCRNQLFQEKCPCECVLS